MINTINTKIESLVIHRLGHVSENTDIELSASPFIQNSGELQDTEKSSLLKSLFRGFKEPIFYRFDHQIFLDEGNVVYKHSRAVFENETTLYEASIPIARWLYHKASQSIIKDSYLVVCKFSDMLIEDELLEGILLAKFETKESILIFNKEAEVWQANFDYGYLLDKIDKCCLILNADEDLGYKVMNVENKSPDGKYWKEDFLRINLSGNDYTYTSDIIKITGNFLKSRKAADEEVGTTDKIEMLQKSYDYIKNKDSYDEEEYKAEVFSNGKLVEAFDEYKSAWQEKTQRPVAQQFDLSEFALQKQQSVFKSVIKLDRNFHIYVHGDHTKIEKGVDENNRKYYILYYNEES
jgi:hypothetical protein